MELITPGDSHRGYYKDNLSNRHLCISLHFSVWAQCRNNLKNIYIVWNHQKIMRIFSLAPLTSLKRTAPFLALLPLSHCQGTWSNPKLHLPLRLAIAAHFHNCLSILFSFLPLSFSRTLPFSVVTLITMRSKRWHSLLQRYNGRIQQMHSLMKCLHPTAPWFITYFCHNA